MVSIPVSKDRFDKIIRLSSSSDSVQISLTAKASKPFLIKTISNSVEHDNLRNDSIIESALEMQVSSKVGINFIDIIFACEGENSAHSKSLEIYTVKINDTLILKTNYGMDRVDWQADDLSCFTAEQRQRYTDTLSNNHGGYFGFFGRVRIPYYRFYSTDAARIYKRSDYGVECGGRYSIIYDRPPAKTKDVLKDE